MWLVVPGPENVKLYTSKTNKHSDVVKLYSAESDHETGHPSVVHLYCEALTPNEIKMSTRKGLITGEWITNPPTQITVEE
jgi:hypothetical protein